MYSFAGKRDRNDFFLKVSKYVDLCQTEYGTLKYHVFNLDHF